jgi:hypothetical protein
MKEPNPAASHRRDTASRTALGAAQAWERRTKLVKDELAAASAANDAKTARLRALRLEKEAGEARDAAEKAATPPAAGAPAPASRKRGIRRIVVS